MDVVNGTMGTKSPLKLDQYSHFAGAPQYASGFVATQIPSFRPQQRSQGNRRNARAGSMLRKVTFGVGRAVRETGQALDRLGLRVLGDNAFNERCACRRLPDGFVSARRHRSPNSLFTMRQSPATARS